MTEVHLLDFLQVQHCLCILSPSNTIFELSLKKNLGAIEIQRENIEAVKHKSNTVHLCDWMICDKYDIFFEVHKNIDGNATIPMKSFR